MVIWKPAAPLLTIVTLLQSAVGPPDTSGGDSVSAEAVRHRIRELIDNETASTVLSDDKLVELLRDAGLLKGETLYDVDNVSVVHHVTQALRAHTMFERDTDYIVKDGRVVIIDEFTGRMMEGRRFSEGMQVVLRGAQLADEALQNSRVGFLRH